MATDLKRTPLFEEHEKLGAKLVPFAGYLMPVQYTAGILEEHRAVRTRAGLFDVSHMGELEVRGNEALALAQYAMTNDVSKLEIGQAQYSMFCREDGGAIDDCVVYRFDDHYMIVVNASNREKDRDWLEDLAGRFDVDVIDRSDEIGLLAIQGPLAQSIVSKLTDADLESIAYYHYREGDVAGIPTIISRTGYTGEDGFELYVPAGDAAALWRALIDAGKSDGLIPAGLGARDSLRLEMGYALYGNDLDENHSPLEAGLGWIVKLDKGDFVGSEALARLKQKGVREKLVGFMLGERGFPRHGYAVLLDGEPAGEVTSGIHSPSLQQGIGMAYVPVEGSKPGTPLQIVIRDRAHQAEVVRTPFYKDGSVRR
jgi:aminomethyltransferase